MAAIFLPLTHELYGAGWLGSRILPKTLDRTKLPKTLAMLGGLVGAAPGVASWGSSAVSGSGDPDALLNAPPPRHTQFQAQLPVYPQGAGDEASFVPNPAYDPTAHLPMPQSLYTVVNAAFTDVVGDPVHPVVKAAQSQSGYEIDFNPPLIPIDYVSQPEQLALTRSAWTRDRQLLRRTDWSVLEGNAWKAAQKPAAPSSCGSTSTCRRLGSGM